MKFKNLFKKREYVTKEDIVDLKEKIFKKKKESAYENRYDLMMSYYMGSNYETITLEEEIEILQDKLDLVAKHLGIKFAISPSKDEKIVIKKKRKYKKKS